MEKKPTYEELETRIKYLEEKLEIHHSLEDQSLKGAKKPGLASNVKTNSSGINIEWDNNDGECTFKNLPVAMMWIDTTLKDLMSRFESMVGIKRFTLALQVEGRKSVDADWQVISQFSEFKEGFKAIADIAAVAGWGKWTLISLDEQNKECRFRIQDSWEGKYQKALGVCWGSDMLAGKLSGYASKLFSTNCRAEQKAFIAEGDEYDEFLVRPSEWTIEKEIQNPLLGDDDTKADVEVALEELQNEVKERERAEDDERKLQSQLLNTIKIAQVGPWEYDPTTDLFTFNDFFYKIFRTSAEEVGGYTMSMDQYTERFIPPEVREYTHSEAMKVVQANEPLASNMIEHKIIRADGTFGYISVRSFVVKDAEGNILRIYGVNQDVTDRKNAEEKLRESEEKLIRAKKMESLGLLAGGVAHDLNNVLSGIVSYPELLLLDLPEDSPLRKPIETIQDSGNKAVAIVQDLLTIARGVATSKETLNLNHIVNEYLLSPEFTKLRQFHPTVQVTTEFDPDLLNITGSVVHIRKVVMNLISNAAEAIESSGNITISTRNCYIDRPIRKYEDVIIGEYAVISISDDGLGIAQDHIDRIFEPFFTKKVMGMSGTGLGLTMVWNIVQDHEGYIDVESNKKGTKFELYFPTTRDMVLEKSMTQSLKTLRGSGENILIVDDEKNQREISSSMLKTLDYNTVTVSSGEMAIEYLKESKADLILLDMIMDPGINGRETYERILEYHPLQKAIIVSGFAETDEVKKAQSLGAGQYVRKPFTLERIGVAIKNELKRS